MIVWRSVDPLKLDPVFRADVEKLLAESPYTWYVLHGYRSYEEQSRLWEAYKAGGPKAAKAAPPGKSPHNYGLAIDVAADMNPEIAGLQPDWNITHPAWTWLFDAVFSHPRLHSGRSFQDADHIEAVNWKSIASQNSADEIASLNAMRRRQ